LVYNPDFVAEKSHDAIVTLLIHEVEHVLFGHHIRQQGRDHEGWNIATDLAINSHLLHRPGFHELQGLYPGGEPYPDLPAGQTGEWYYNEITKRPPEQPEQPEQDGEGEGEGEGGNEGESEPSSGGSEEKAEGQDQSQPGDQEGGEPSGEGDNPQDGTGNDPQNGQKARSGSGEGQDSGGGSQGPKSELPGRDRIIGEVLPSPEPEQLAESERQQLVVQCAAGCPPGKMPGHLKTLVDSATKPVEVPWQVLLRRFCEKRCKSRLTYSRVHRRLGHLPERLPTRGGKTLGEICVVLDTSGSHWGKAPEILDHIEVIAKAYPGTSVRLIQFDTEAKEKLYTKHDLPIDRKRWELSGGGGTALQPAWQMAQKSRASCIVVFTDGYLYDWPTEKSKSPVIWLLSTSEEVPCPGLVVRVK
jgi:predicted metal-dependent peptidase